MRWVIPGTILSTDLTDAAQIESQLRSMFLAGGIVLSQVSGITGLENYTVQNWVKRGFLSNPEKKRYSLNQLCRIININMLKSALAMEDICGLLGYINGALDDESDDMIDDSTLYFIFLQTACRTQDYMVDSPDARNALIHECLQQYQEPVPGARERVEKVLRIMLTAYGSSMLRLQAESMLKELK